MYHLPQRQQIRNPYHDYSKPCSYFITIDVRLGQCLFGFAQTNYHIELNPLGKMAEKCWQEIPVHFPHIILGKYVVMPNHIHGIVHLQSLDEKDKGYENIELPIRFDPSLPVEPNRFGPLKKGSLAVVLNQYKSAVTRWANSNQHGGVFDWHDRFYDRIVKDKEALFLAEKYIEMNPQKWWIKYGNMHW